MYIITWARHLSMLRDGQSLQSMTTVLFEFTSSVSWLLDVISTIFDIVVRKKFGV